MAKHHLHIIFLYLTVWKVKVKLLSCVRLFETPWTVACTRLLRPWDFLGKSTGVGCHFLLQGIFPTQGSSPGPPHSNWLINKQVKENIILWVGGAGRGQLWWKSSRYFIESRWQGRLNQSWNGRSIQEESWIQQSPVKEGKQTEFRLQHSSW